MSITRLTADTALALVRRGIPVTVLYPVVDWWDYKRMQFSRSGTFGKWKWGIKLVLETIGNGLFRRRWCGFKHYPTDPRIKAERFFLTPRTPQSEAESHVVTVVHPPYLMPHVLRGLNNPHAKVVSVVHINYEQELQSPVPEHRAWKQHCFAVDRLMRVPRVTSSQRAKEAAERMGLPVNRVIITGIALQLFRPPAHAANGPLTVSLSCATHPQKGQRVGAEAIKLARERLGGRVRFCSIGHVLPEYKELFDHNYGFLNGQAYVEAMQRSDIFVYPSLYDGFPVPPLEAMACGSAVVTTAVEGVTEYAVDGDNCVLCDAGNARQLCEGIVRLVEDAALHNRLREAGPKTAHRYDVEYTTQQWIDFLEDVVAERETAMIET